MQLVIARPQFSTLPFRWLREKSSLVYMGDYSTFQVGCLREIGSNGEIGIRSIKLMHKPLILLSI